MRKIFWIVVVVLCLGGGSVRAQTDDSALTAPEQAQLTDIRRLLADHAAEVWPGWEDYLPPLLVRKGDFDYLIGHPNPPDGFVEVRGQVINDEPVFRGKGHLTPAPVATAWPVGEIWAAATPVRDEFQQAVDELLGEGVIVLDEVAFVRAVVHEGFHAYQMNLLGGPENLPPFVQMSSELSWLDPLSDSEKAALDDALADEGQVLNNALADGASDEDVRRAVAEFLRLRAERRASLPEAAVEFERAVEWVEGAARYADTRLMLLFEFPDYKPVETWDAFRAQVGDPLSIPGDYRERFYVLGAAQMFVLDRLSTDWQERLLEEGLLPEDLLSEYLE